MRSNKVGVFELSVLAAQGIPGDFILHLFDSKTNLKKVLATQGILGDLKGLALFEPMAILKRSWDWKPMKTMESPGQLYS